MQNLKDKNLYYVGGVVRDEFLGTKSFDVDFCYEGNAIEFAKRKKLNIIKENPSFGTVKINYNGKEIDIASTREESYPRAGHLPVITRIGCSLEDDLKRRDFTANSMAKNTLTGEIFDPFRGIDDIKAKQLRVLHSKSFIDDPSRIIRGLKFSVRFGFKLSKETEALQKEYLNNVNYDMSMHRLKKELDETFNLNIGEAFNKFTSLNMINLFEKKYNPLNINGAIIEKTIKEYNLKECGIIYYGCLGLDSDSLPFSRKEKRILEWAKRLEEEPSNNNTPKESIIIAKLRSEVI